MATASPIVSPDELEPLIGARMLITGADGMLGRAFREGLQPLGDKVELVALPHEELDVTDAEAVLALAGRGFDIIVHCAAMTLADECERDPDRARLVQVVGTENVARLALATGARVLYPQSVFIFDGKELPVTEQTAPAPVHVYGRVKLEAECLLLAQVPETLAVRMAGFFGGDGKDKNFVGQFVRQVEALLAQGGGSIEVGDRMWQPTYTLDLARNALLLVAAGRHGVFHMGGLGEATFFDVARICVDALGLAGEIDLRPCAAEAFARAELAPRPLRMVTANHRLDAEGLCRQRCWEDALREYLARPYFDAIRRGAAR